MVQIAPSAALALAVCGVTASCNCVNFTVPVTVEDVTTVALTSTIVDGFAATEYANMLTRRGAPMPKLNTTKLTATFNISAEYCVPEGASSSTLQILTHGIGFDRSYWDYVPTDYPMNTEYSYIDAAMKAGYSTFSWDRLGIAPSTLADPYSEIQTSVEIEILIQLTQMIRTGKISQVPQPEKVVHVGHSFGSQLTHALASKAPELSDGLVLTGFSDLNDFQTFFIASSSYHIASENNPRRFPASSYSNGYLTWPDVYNFQYAFLAYPYFNESVARDVESRKQPFTIGEFMSGGLFPGSADNFTGPVLYWEAEYDVIFCGGNCTGIVNSTSPAATSLKGSSGVTIDIQAEIGHAINVHYNASGAYQGWLDWIKANGF